MSGLQPSEQGGTGPHPYGMGLKYIGLAALSGNGYVQGTRCPNANFANERSTHRRDAMICVSTTCTPVIPNAVRNPARKERFIADTLNDKESALNDRVEERAVHVGANLCVHPS